MTLSASPCPASEPRSRWGGAFLGAALLAGAGGGAAAAPAPTVVLGGTSTMTDLEDPANTDGFRAAGGGLYLHHSGWTSNFRDPNGTGRNGGNDRAARLRVANRFAGNGPMHAELGFIGELGWSQAFEKFYVNYGLNVDTISVNGLSGIDEDSNATLATAKSYIDRFKGGNGKPGYAGVKRVQIVLSPNRSAQQATEFPFASLHWDDQREMARYGGGWTSDAPPRQFFALNSGYRDWIVDQTRWTQAQGLHAVNIISPNGSDENLFRDSVKYVRYLEEHDAIPDQWVVENYTHVGDPPAGYVNRIGSEDNPNHLAFTARWLVGHVEGRPETLDLVSGPAVTGGAVVGAFEYSGDPGDAVVALSDSFSEGLFRVDLNNRSTDATTGFYAANLSAAVVGDVDGWGVAFTLDGVDVTDAVLGDGFRFADGGVLEAGAVGRFEIELTRLASAEGGFTLNLFAKASPHANRVADAVSFRFDGEVAVPEPAGLSLVVLSGAALLRRRPRVRAAAGV